MQKISGDLAIITITSDERAIIICLGIVVIHHEMPKWVPCIPHPWIRPCYPLATIKYFSVGVLPVLPCIVSPWTLCTRAMCPPRHATLE